jgi:hypothetical protein
MFCVAMCLVGWPMLWLWVARDWGPACCFWRWIQLLSKPCCPPNGLHFGLPVQGLLTSGVSGQPAVSACRLECRLQFTPYALRSYAFPDAADMPSLDLTAVEVAWGNGSTTTHWGQVASFGPAFLADCAPGGAEGQCSDSSAEQQQQQQGEGGACAADLDASHQEPAAGQGQQGQAAQQRRQQRQAEQQRQAPPAQGASAADEEEEEEEDDDPYLDPDEEEEEGEGQGEGGGEEGREGQPQQHQRPPSLCVVEGPAVAAAPLDACSRLQNERELQGAIAVVRRGE